MTSINDTEKTIGIGRILLTAAVIAVGITVSFITSSAIRNSAEANWENSVDAETRRLTSVFVQWIESSMAPLNALGAVVLAQQSLSETEFWDSVALLEDNDPDFFPSALLVSSELNGNWVVDFSIEDRGLLVPGAILKDQSGIKEGIDSALEMRGQTVIGGFWFQDGIEVDAIAALTVETVLQDRLVLAAIDLTSLLDGLSRTQIPTGIELVLSGQPNQAEDFIRLADTTIDENATLESRTIRAQTGLANFKFDWHITNEFAGGRSSTLADLVASAGILLALFAAGFVYLLIGQNRKIRALVTERTEELAERESELRLALDNMPGGMMLTDADLNIRLLNDKFLDNVELDRNFLKPGDPLEKLIRELVARGGYYRDAEPSEKDMVSERLDHASSADCASFKHDTPGGRIIEVHRERIEAGGSVTVTTDVTKRVRAEDDLKIFRWFAESSSNGLGIAEMDTKKIKYVNKALRELLEEDDLETVQSKGIPSYYTPEGQQKLADEVFPSLMNTGHWSGELSLLTAKNSALSTLENYFVLSDEAGNPRYFADVIIDITERRAAETALREAKLSAEEALNELQLAQERLLKTEKMASLGQLTAGIAHEIKNPLNFVNNFSETSIELLEELTEDLEDLLEKAPEDKREDIKETIDLLKGDLTKIHSHGSRADGIVRSMLLHARGDEADRVSVSANDLMKEAFQLAYHGERARNQSFNVAIDEQFDENAGDFQVASQEITRVLVNILSNAFYAMMEKKQSGTAQDYEPTVILSTQPLDGKIRLIIRDNGTGMPEDVRKKLFDPFFTTKPTGLGTGLGLSISYDIIVQQHVGNMEVTSQPGEYTEFIIDLPTDATAKKGA